MRSNLVLHVLATVALAACTTASQRTNVVIKNGRLATQAAELNDAAAILGSEVTFEAGKDFGNVVYTSRAYGYGRSPDPNAYSITKNGAPTQLTLSTAQNDAFAAALAGNVAKACSGKLNGAVDASKISNIEINLDGGQALTPDATWFNWQDAGNCCADNRSCPKWIASEVYTADVTAKVSSATNVAAGSSVSCDAAPAQGSVDLTVDTTASASIKTHGWTVVTAINKKEMCSLWSTVCERISRDPGDGSRTADAKQKVLDTRRNWKCKDEEPAWLK